MRLDSIGSMDDACSPSVQLGDDYMESRELYQAAHLALAWAAVERGDLVLGGRSAQAHMKT